LVKLSAIRSAFSLPFPWIVIVFLSILTPLWGQSAACAPAPEIRAQLEKTTVVVSAPSDFDRGISPLLALRQRFPNDLWVNEKYQDAVQQFGIEGHLRELTEEYQVFSMQHPDDLIFSYLYARSLMGRNTPSAIQQMNDLLAARPNFAPIHASLAEIYASDTFHDAAKEKIERERFLELCPESSGSHPVLQRRPSGLPQPSSLIEQAERRLAEHHPEHAADMAMEGIRDDEWRLQRIRPFDWYSVDFKRQAQRDLQSKYWRMWSIQVRCARLAGRTEEADKLLAVMDQRTAALRADRDAVYWDALVALSSLYQEANQKDLATKNLNLMQAYLAAHPDPSRTAQLALLRQKVETGNK
jgi:hypothetical protein